MTTLRGRQIILHYLIWVELQHKSNIYFTIEDVRTTYDDNLITNKDFITVGIEDSYFTSSG